MISGRFKVSRESQYFEPPDNLTALTKTSPSIFSSKGKHWYLWFWKLNQENLIRLNNYLF